MLYHHFPVYKLQVRALLGSSPYQLAVSSPLAEQVSSQPAQETELAYYLTACLSRVLRAMAGDKGVPLSKVFRALNEHTRTPVNAVWAMAALAFLLGLPLLYSTSVFSAIASISSVGLYLSCEWPATSTRLLGGL